MLLIALVGFFNQPFVKSLLAGSAFVASHKQNCISFWVKRKGNSPNTAISPESQFLHVGKC